MAEGLFYHQALLSLTAEGVRFVVVGDVAVNLQGVPRFTADLVEVRRRLGIGQCAAMTFELSDVLRCVTEAGIRHRHPGYDNEMVRLALIRLWLGSELFRRIHPAVEIDP